MSNTGTLNTAPNTPSNSAPQAPRGYVANLVMAAGAASVSAVALSVSQQPNMIGQPLGWQAGSVAAGLIAARLTLAAMKQQQTAAPATGDAARRALLDSLSAKLDAAAAALRCAPESREGEALGTAEAQKPQRIEAERERLTKAGFSKAEISQILIAKETGAAQATGGGGHGALSGVLSNLAAVTTHAKNFLPGLLTDLARMLNRRVPPLQRLEAAFTFVAKCAVIGMLAYVVDLEFITLKANAQRARADACETTMKVYIDSTPLVELGNDAMNKKIDELCK